MRRSRFSGWLLAVLRSFYRVLLVAYPKDFRRAYAEQMAQVFDDLCVKELRRSGVAGLLELWVYTIGDLIVTAGVERSKMRGVSALMERLQGAISQSPRARFFTIALLMGVPFGVFNGLYASFSYSNSLGASIVGGIMGGIFFGLGMAVFFKAFTGHVSREFAAYNPAGSAEGLFRRGLANHRAAGGQLYLTDERLLFVSHKYNLFLNHELSIPLEEVTSIRPRQTMGVIPNGLEVIWGDKKERFVVQVQDRQEWIGELQQRLSEHSG